MFFESAGRWMKLGFCLLQFAGVSGEICSQHNLHRTGHIQICKQDIASARLGLSHFKISRLTNAGDTVLANISIAYL